MIMKQILIKAVKEVAEEEKIPEEKIWELIPKIKKRSEILRGLKPRGFFSSCIGLGWIDGFLVGFEHSSWLYPGLCLLHS